MNRPAETSCDAGVATRLGDYCPRVESHGRVHCAQDYDLANVTAVEVDGGYVVVDTASSREAATRIRQEFEKTLQGKPQAVIYTHSHHDHVGGVSVFRDEPIPIWAQAGFRAEMFQSQMLPNAYFLRAARQFGYGLSPEQVVTNGIGPPLRLDEGALPPIFPPTDTVDQTAEVTFGNVPFQLFAAPGETHDHLFIWLPEQRTLLAGDNIYRAFPNLYAIRGVPARPVRQWIESLDAMRRLDPRPEVLVMGHTPPVVGAEAIHELLTVYRDGIAFVHDNVVRMANEGKTPDQMVAELSLPPHLANHPYLAPLYGTLRGGIRGVYNGYMGWFDGNATNLDPLSMAELSSRLLPLLGGRSALQGAIEKALAAKDFRGAAWMCDLVLAEKPKDRQAKAAKAQALSGLAEVIGNPLMRSWCLTDAALLRGEKCLPKRPKVGSQTVSEVPIEQIMRVMPQRLHPRRTRKVKMRIGFDFTDSGKQFTLIIRQGVGEIQSGLEDISGEESVPDLILRCTESDFKRILVAREVGPVKPEFWQRIELIVPSGPLASIRKLRRLARFGALMVGV